jgi:hypothetical protein
MKRSLIGALAATLLCASELAAAGPFADDMARCMVSSTSAEDRTVFVKWIFSIITLHPDLTAMSTVTAKQREDISRKAGAMLERLLLDSCRSQTQQAIQNEGPETIKYAFQVLGQVASRGLLSEPHVLAGAKDLGKYVDEERLKALTARATQQ